MRILAISGSLRAHSTNTTLLKAVILAAPAPDFQIDFYDELAEIPPFNPDLETALQDHGAIARFRQRIKQAEAVLISTPEYAHGMPGALKNALDWIVGSGELSEKPVALAQASRAGEYAQASLREVLRTMNAKVIEQADLIVDIRGKGGLTPQDLIASVPGFPAAVARSLRALTPPIDKLAWIHIVDRRILNARSKGKDTYYIPGGKRNPGETDQQALIREVKEELTVDLTPGTIQHLHTFEAQAHGKPEGIRVRLTCYEAGYTGTLTPAAEIEEIAWLTYQDRESTSPVSKLLFDWLKQQDRID